MIGDRTKQMLKTRSDTASQRNPQALRTISPTSTTDDKPNNKGSFFHTESKERQLQRKQSGSYTPKEAWKIHGSTITSITITDKANPHTVTDHTSSPLQAPVQSKRGDKFQVIASKDTKHSYDQWGENTHIDGRNNNTEIYAATTIEDPYPHILRAGDKSEPPGRKYYPTQQAKNVRKENYNNRTKD